MVRLLTAAAVMAAVFLAIYLPDIGHGFIKDDFGWIVDSRVSSVADAAGLFSRNVGFYRPLVALTFSADDALWGANAFGFGLTNLALAVVAAVLLFSLARRLELPAAAALLAVGVWLFNFHAVNMALLWISGRTALLVCIFSLATASMFLRRRIWLASALCLAAMLSKEEAVALPAFFILFDQSRLVEADLPAFAGATAGRQVRLRALMRTWPLWLSLAIYFALRMPSGAFWPTDAPSYYAFSLSPTLLIRNILEYADRAGTLALAVGLLLAVFGRVRRRTLDAREGFAIIFAGLWILATYAITVFLPVRSSLYALLPSIGSALAVGAIASAAARQRPAVFRKIAIALLVAVVALIPVYRSRNVRWTGLAELSERVITTVQDAVSGRPEGGHIVLVDNLEERFNLDSALGSLLPQALTLRVGGQWSGEVVARPEDAQQPADLTFALSNGKLER